VKRLRHWRGGAFLALLGMLFQLAVTIGHVDGEGPFHRDGLLLSSIDGFAHTLTGAPVSHDDQNGGRQRDYCPLCWLHSVAGSLTLPVVTQVHGLPVSFDIAWPIKAQDVQSIRRSLLYEIRGPPSL
jgi:hypothetical protein